MNFKNVKVPKIPDGGAASTLIKFGAVIGIGLYAASNSLYNVEGGHRAIVFNRIVGFKDRDHYFDVVTNVVGLVVVLGDRFYWWIDPVGAIILAVYTIVNWPGSILENAVSLVGQSAHPEVLQKLTYLVTRHPKVKRVDTVRAYTFGVLDFVEVDIELPEELSLKEAHAIGETLQIKFEKLPEVERAFVL